MRIRAWCGRWAAAPGMLLERERRLEQLGYGCILCALSPRCDTRLPPTHPLRSSASGRWTRRARTSLLGACRATSCFMQRPCRCVPAGQGRGILSPPFFFFRKRSGSRFAAAPATAARTAGAASLLQQAHTSAVENPQHIACSMPGPSLPSDLSRPCCHLHCSRTTPRTRTAWATPGPSLRACSTRCLPAA